MVTPRMRQGQSKVPLCNARPSRDPEPSPWVVPGWEALWVAHSPGRTEPAPGILFHARGGLGAARSQGDFPTPVRIPGKTEALGCQS